MKKVLAILLTIAVALSVIADILWLGLYVYEKRVLNVTTVYVGKLNKANNEQAVLNINYYKNKNNSGYEVLEIMFKTYTDVEKTQTFDYGIQYINPEFKFTKEKLKKTNLVTSKFHTYYSNNSEYTKTYNGTNGTWHEALDNNIKDKNFLIIFDDVQDNTYTMEFVGSDKQKEKGWWVFKDKYYNDYDINWFSAVIYEAVKNNSGSDEYFDFSQVFDVSNIFEFRKQDSIGNFSEIDSKFVDVLKTYMTCKLKIVESGMTKAEGQSMFNMFNGLNDFDITHVLSTSDYFTQTQYYILTDEDFNYYLKENGTSYRAVIKTSVLNNLKKLKIENVYITLNQNWQRVNGITLSESDIDIKTLNKLKYDLVTIL